METRRKMRMGMVGGGQDAFTGAVHRMAAALDGQIELVCGVFRSDPQRLRDSGEELFLSPQRCYPDFATMFRAEAELPAGERMDFVSIVTPNHGHFAAAQVALEHGFHVVSDKVATLHLEEAWRLQDLVAETGLLYILTHNYTGYPLVREARRLVEDGVLGEIRKVVVEYPQGWLFRRQEAEGQKQAPRRTGPARCGAAGAMGDIGSHADNLVEFVTGLQIESLCADLTTFVDGRELDDDGNVLLRFHGGAKGVLHASQISIGEENNLSLRVYGTLAGLEWRQQEPNTLLLKWPDQPTQVLRSGGAYLGATAAAATRLPPGHPEAYLEAFANLYRETATLIRQRLAGEQVRVEESLLPGIEEGVRGMAFIQAVVQSSCEGAVWTPLPRRPQMG